MRDPAFRSYARRAGNWAVWLAYAAFVGVIFSQIYRVTF